MPETATPTEQAKLIEEIGHQREEILRLRDLLIAKDAELGAAKGRLAELTEHSARFPIAARTIQARALSVLRAPARLLRRG